MTQRKILVANRFKTGYGTHHYDVKYQGEWNKTALINCIDAYVYEPTDEQYEYYNNEDLKLNFGGYVERVYSDENTGITRARVGVYYD